MARRTVFSEHLSSAATSATVRSSSFAACRLSFPVWVILISDLCRKGPCLCTCQHPDKRQHRGRKFPGRRFRLVSRECVPVHGPPLHRGRAGWPNGQLAFYPWGACPITSLARETGAAASAGGSRVAKRAYDTRECLGRLGCVGYPGPACRKETDQRAAGRPCIGVA